MFLLKPRGSKTKEEASQEEGRNNALTAGGLDDTHLAGVISFHDGLRRRRDVLARRKGHGSRQEGGGDGDLHLLLLWSLLALLALGWFVTFQKPQEQITRSRACLLRTSTLKGSKAQLH